MSTRRFSTLVALALTGCEPESVCEDGAAPVIHFDQTPVEIKPGVPLVLTGTLTSQARVDQLIVGGTSAKGTSPNFTTWEVTIPSVRFDNVPGAWELESVAVVCGDLVVVDSQSVLVAIPDLSLSLSGDVDACYLGANGAGTATVAILADQAYANAKVTLAAPEGTQLLPGTTTFLDEDGAGVATLISTGKQDAGVSVTATNGNRTFASEPITIAGPPTFDAEPKAISNGLSVPIFVKTRGRLASCAADLPAGASAVLHVDGDSLPLSTAGSTIDKEGCGQTFLIRVDFAAGSALGSTMVLSCTDTYGQTATRVVSSSGTP